MTSKAISQRPNKVKIGIGRDNKCKKYKGTEYYLDGDKMYIKLSNKNFWIIISDIDYRDDFITEITLELLVAHNVVFDVSEIFKKEGYRDV